MIFFWPVYLHKSNQLVGACVDLNKFFLLLETIWQLYQQINSGETHRPMLYLANAHIISVRTSDDFASIVSKV